MEKIGLVAEATTDLPEPIIKKHKIAVVPVKLDWPELEGIPGENTFQKMRELERRGIKSFGKTSQPSPKDYLNQYKFQLERFTEIICLPITSKLSGSYNSAVMAKSFLRPEDQKRIFVVDSQSGSSGQALIVLKAADLIKKEGSAEEIVRELEEFIPKVHFFLMLDDPKWLEASGRISHLIAAFLRRLGKSGIRPLLSFKRGLLVPAGIKMGAKDIPTALFKQFQKEVQKSRTTGKKNKVAITHGDDQEGAQRLQEMIEEEFKNVEIVFVNTLGNVLAAPAGPNSMTIAWHEID